MPLQNLPIERRPSLLRTVRQWLILAPAVSGMFILAFRTLKLAPAASPATPMAKACAAMIASKMVAAGAARLGHTSRCHACRGGLRGPLGTRGMEARAYATQRLPPDHASG